MKAIVFERDGSVRLDELPMPTVGDEELLILVGAAGICASDLHLAEINRGVVELPYPLIPGHEIAGAVVAVGSHAAGHEVGQHVAIHPMIPCGQCILCRKGQPHLCRLPQVVGLHRPGGFAEYVVAPVRNAYPADDLPDSVAACAEPLACALHGINRLAPAVADRALLFGAGTIGLFALQLLRLCGLTHISVVDRLTARCARAEKLGADTILTSDVDLDAELVRRAPAGFDCVIDATGVPSVIEAAMRHVAWGGKILLLGSPPASSTIAVRPRLIQRREGTVIGSFGFCHEFGAALELLKTGCIRTDAIVTDWYPLERFASAWAQAQRGGESVKVQIAKRDP